MFRASRSRATSRERLVGEGSSFDPLLTKGLLADFLAKARRDDNFQAEIKKMGMDPTKDLDDAIMVALTE